jgi:hypothetical protein
MKRNKLTTGFLVMCLLVVVVRLTATADIPHGINYQGRLTDASGNPVPDGNYQITFTIYDAATDGNVKWTSGSQAVGVTNGAFSYELGSVAPFLPANLFADTLRWLGIKVGTDPEIVPRTKLTSVPYAYQALTGAGWTDDGDVVRLTTGSDKVRIGGWDPMTQLTKLAVEGDVNLQSDGVGGGEVAMKVAGAEALWYNGTYFSWGFGGNFNYFADNVGIGDAPGEFRLCVTSSDNVAILGRNESVLPTMVLGNYLEQGEGEILRCDAWPGGVWTPVFSVRNNGRIAVGTGNPGKHALYVTSAEHSDYGNGSTIFAENTNTDKGIAIRGSSSSTDPTMTLANHGTGEILRCDAYPGGVWTPVFSVRNNGRVKCAELELTGGSDIVEPFEMTGGQTLPKGAVVVIDPENPGKLMLSDGPYDTRVAGIVSGAGGVNPGIMLTQKDAFVGGQNIAISGRVYCLVDASFGSITPGDLLTTSPNPGHAMKAADRERSYGAVIGKAMTGLDNGQGLVLVLVNLQ